MHKLEQYYSGDINWKKFVELYDEFWLNNDFQKKLLNKLNENIDLAKVIYGKFGESSFKIIEQKVPALDNLTPIECLETAALIKRLKECLMRMP